MMGEKWKAFKANPMTVVTGLLKDLFFPIVGNVQDIIQLFHDIKKIVTGPLNADSLQDLWTSLLQILDIPIMIYNTAVSILMRTLMLPLLIASLHAHPWSGQLRSRSATHCSWPSLPGWGSTSRKRCCC